MIKLHEAVADQLRGIMRTLEDQRRSENLSYKEGDHVVDEKRKTQERHKRHKIEGILKRTVEDLEELQF